MNEMKKQRQQEQMEQMRHQMARRGEIFAEYPEIGKFIKTKEAWLKALKLIGLIVYVVRAVVIRSMTGGSIGALVLGVLMGYGLFFIALTSCRSVSVRIVNNAAMICTALFALNIFQLINNIRKIAASAGIFQIYRELFQINPLFVVSDIAVFVYLLLVCTVVLLLTQLPKNKQILKQFEELSNN